MKVFISWSGERSKSVAAALHTLLPDVLQDVEVWMSAHDIDAGAKWNSTLSSELQSSNFGVLCLTPENLASPWLLFEAGSISKSVTESHVVPFLFGLRPADVTFPLAQFQGVEATRDGTLKLVRAMNSLRAEPMPDVRLRRVFDRWWPDLEAKLAEIPSALAAAPARRDERSILEEILEHVRNATPLRAQPLPAVAAPTVATTPTSMVWKSVHQVTESDLQAMSLNDVINYVDAVNKRFQETQSPGEETALDRKEALALEELRKRGFDSLKAARDGAAAASQAAHDAQVARAV